jgi:hypothetical protein
MRVADHALYHGRKLPTTSTFLLSAWEYVLHQRSLLGIGLFVFYNTVEHMYSYMKGW